MTTARLAGQKPAEKNFTNRFTSPDGDSGVPLGTTPPLLARKALRVKHTVCRHGMPLCVLQNLPGEGAEMRPEQMRALAFALLSVASDAEAMRSAKPCGAITLEYPL